MKPISYYKLRGPVADLFDDPGIRIYPLVSSKADSLQKSKWEFLILHHDLFLLFIRKCS